MTQAGGLQEFHFTPGMRDTLRARIREQRQRARRRGVHLEGADGEAAARCVDEVSVFVGLALWLRETAGDAKKVAPLRREIANLTHYLTRATERLDRMSPGMKAMVQQGGLDLEYFEARRDFDCATAILLARLDGAEKLLAQRRRPMGRPPETWKIPLLDSTAGSWTRATGCEAKGRAFWGFLRLVLDVAVRDELGDDTPTEDAAREKLKVLRGVRRNGKRTRAIR